MKAPARLGLYGLGLVIVFIVAGFTANAVVPEETAQNWVDETAQANQHGEGNMTDASGQGGTSSVALSLGLGVANDGYQLTDLVAPAQIGSEGPLSLVISGPDGQPMTDFQSEHEKELHLIVVRADGQHFRHVHPKMSVDGTWSIPWQWDAAGTYRVFTDFVPAATGRPDPWEDCLGNPGLLHKRLTRRFAHPAFRIVLDLPGHSFDADPFERASSRSMAAMASSNSARLSAESTGDRSTPGSVSRPVPPARLARIRT